MPSSSIPSATSSSNLRAEVIERDLCDLLGAPVKCLKLDRLGEPPVGPGLDKAFGYGEPLEVEYEVGGELRRAVIHTMRPDAFGHDDMSDRAATLLWSHHAFNELPRHTRSLDVGAIHGDGHLASLGDIRECFLLTEYVDGRPYASDFKRLAEGTAPEALDSDRADALCDYLISIHATKKAQPGLYLRRARELVGHGECIMGLVDSYPLDHPWIRPALLESLEMRAVAWRWRLKSMTHRLAQVHGDFHPWNILFQKGADFRLLDRSRGQWGEPADDLTALTLNYVFEALRTRGTFEGAFRELFERFWARYVRATGDEQVLDVAGPFAAFRGLVMASPVWYPDLEDDVRRRMLNLVRAVLDDDTFHPDRVENYLDRG